MPFDQAKSDEILAKICGKVKNNNQSTNSEQPTSEPPPVESPTPEQAFWKWSTRIGLEMNQAWGKVPPDQRKWLYATKPEELIDVQVAAGRDLIKVYPAPADLSASDVDEQLHLLAEKSVGAFLGNLPAKPKEEELPALPFHDFDLAELATEEYLKRTPVVEGLCYSSATSMITGGKHAGKSTLMRWLAICVVKGYPFLGRQVVQGPVIYCASEDEELPAMSELRRLGWTRGDPIIFLPKSKIPDDMDEQAVLHLLADKVNETKAVMIAVDMLFDFIPVQDELAYAGTRRATGMLQKVASVTGCHIVCVHHAPKHTDKNAEVTITALGSMGLAARVSPMILVVRWAHAIHTIETSDVRDPRGKPIEKMRLLQNEDGSMVLGQRFKEYMLATAYAERVLEVIIEEPGQEFTIRNIMEICGIESYETARATLKWLFDQNRIQRGGNPAKGRGGYKYFIPLGDPMTPTPVLYPPVGSSESHSDHSDLEAQGRFGYKENYSDQGDVEKMKPKTYSNLPRGEDSDDLDEYGISKSK
jgi:hypothetical protein